MSLFNFTFAGESGQRKYNLTIFFAALTFILALFGQMNEVVSKCLIALFGIAVGGNVGAKVARVLPDLFNKKEAIDEQGK